MEWMKVWAALSLDLFVHSLILVFVAVLVVAVVVVSLVVVAEETQAVQVSFVQKEVASLAELTQVVVVEFDFVVEEER